MTFSRPRRWAPLVVLPLLAMALYLAARRLDLARVLVELRSVRAGWLVLAVAAYAMVLPLWALQWRLIAPRVPNNRFREMLATVAMSASLHNTTLAFVGEGSAVLLLATRIGLDRTSAVSVLAMDQMIVGIAKVALLSTAAAMVTLPTWMARGAETLAVVLGIVIALALVVLRNRERLHARLPERAGAMMTKAALAVQPLRSPHITLSVLLLALAKNGMEIVALLCVQHAFGVQLPLASAVLALAALNLATIIPVVPGNVAVFEGAIILAYAHFGVNAERALGMALVQHACYFVALALPGYRWLAFSNPLRSAAAAS
jgi:uncharacterized membrane protein YbhN (UPF0104 family)